MTSFPDYYNVLTIPKNASTVDIWHAYRRESLKTHPDRLIYVTIEDWKAATEKFQAVADAYYVLSDPQRRREYDMASFPGHYSVLNIPKYASTEDIKQAYRMESFRMHPDRLIYATTEEWKAIMENFQAVADAYHVLPDSASANQQARERALPPYYQPTPAGPLPPTLPLPPATQPIPGSMSHPHPLSQDHAAQTADGYLLSDPQRRREHDRLSVRNPSSSSVRTSDANASSNYLSTFSNGGGTIDGRQMETVTGRGTAPYQSAQRPNADLVFGDVFEDLLRPEVEQYYPLWTWVGTACGACLGFITANVPGLFAGATAGNRLGAIRDAKGKSVAAAFQELSSAQKAEILRTLALKVLDAAFT